MMMNLVRLFSVFVLRLSLEAVCPVHVLGFMVPPVDEHSGWIQPCGTIWASMRECKLYRVHTFES